MIWNHTRRKSENRLEDIRKIVDEILLEQSDLKKEDVICSLIWSIRYLQSACFEAWLCAIAGMLHDIWTYIAGYSADHAKLGAAEARKILNETGNFCYV